MLLLHATQVVEILKPHRKHLISDTLSEEDFEAFVKAKFDNANEEGVYDNLIDKEELTEGINAIKYEAGQQLLEVGGVRRKSGVMTPHERRSMTTDAKVEALDAKVALLDKKMDGLSGDVRHLTTELSGITNVLRSLATGPPPEED
eukprot:COSAG06_NODE_17426_length_941_cov_3.065321_1_plen_146_part_00